MRMMFSIKTFPLVFLAFMQTGLGFAQQASDTPQEPAIVEGVVINAQNGRSVPRAEVILQRIKGPQASKSARADINGRFIFKNVDPGTYRLNAERQGFFSDSHKTGFQPVFDVAAGAHVKDMPVRLMPTAVITGDVVDEYNDPVQNVEVKVFSIRFHLGQPSLTPTGTGLTDDRGEYRIPGLHPGKYYVLAEYKDPAREDNRFVINVIEALEASQSGDKKRQTTEDNKSIEKALEALQGGDKKMQIIMANNVPLLREPSFTYPPLFYPNTSDFLQAQQLPVGPGDEAHANFVFFTMPSVTIKGRVVNGMTGQPAAGAEVSAYWTEYLEGAGVPAKVSPQDGTFEISGMSPGAYTLRASFTSENENFTDQRTMEVGNQGIENVQLACLPDFSASGHVTVQGLKRAAVNHVTVDFIAEGVAPRAQASANRDFKFNAQLHPQTRYHVNVPGLPDDYYLKSVLVSGHDMPQDDVRVSGRRGEIELVISPEGGHIEGTLFDQKDQPVRGPVLLVPDAPQPGPPELFRRSSADSKGKFTLRGVAPGSYRLLGFAGEDLDDTINEPDFLKSIANLGQRIIVEESGSYAVIVKRIEPSEFDR